MSAAPPLADTEAAHGYLRRICFKTGPPGLVGAELEWVVARRDDPRADVRACDLRSLFEGADRFPGGSVMSLEPGGQVELSSLPAPNVTGCCADLASDVTHLESLLGTAGLVLVAEGMDPNRWPTRQIHEPRYNAMATYFNGLGHDLGRIMMTSTAGIQVNLDAGADHADVARRWQLLHLLGPPLSAAFANSPRLRGTTTGWKSTRQAVWLHLDPPRTHPPPTGDPLVTWPEYVLAAPVMMLRTTTGPWLPAPGFSFGEWVGGRVQHLDAPTEEDLLYHLSTLFPPVRPRGWFEVRYLDAQAPAWWTVPVTVLATLLEHPDLTDAATEACLPVADSWLSAARSGLGDGALAEAAQKVFRCVAPAVADPGLRQAVTAFAARYVDRSRSPADDVIDRRDTPTRLRP
ncbi:MAG: ergothioneine biosynthesis glutamate--cysteine ligase EgtA [Ferruginibacter sp.]